MTIQEMITSFFHGHFETETDRQGLKVDIDMALDACRCIATELGRTSLPRYREMYRLPDQRVLQIQRDQALGHRIVAFKVTQRRPSKWTLKND